MAYALLGLDVVDGFGQNSSRCWGFEGAFVVVLEVNWMLVHCSAVRGVCPDTTNFRASIPRLRSWLPRVSQLRFPGPGLGQPPES